MQNFYLQYKKIGEKYLVRSNLTAKMLRNAGHYEEDSLKILSMLLNVINTMGNDTKNKFKTLCLKNGDPLNNAIRICFGYENIEEKDNVLIFANIFNDLCDKCLGFKPIDTK